MNNIVIDVKGGVGSGRHIIMSYLANLLRENGISVVTHGGGDDIFSKTESEDFIKNNVKVHMYSYQVNRNALQHIEQSAN